MKMFKHYGSVVETFQLLAVAGTVVAGAFLFCSGCASYHRNHPVPVTVAEILDMSKAGIPAEEIISKIRASGTVYRLKASQLTELAQNGVPSAVIDYMQQTYLDAVKRDSDYENWGHWTMYGDYWYGGAPYGWPYETVYVVRERRPPERRESSRRERHVDAEKDRRHP